MEELLERLDTVLRRQRPEYYATLLPEATPEEFRRLETALGTPVPDDLSALLAWKNGHPRKDLARGYVYVGEPIWGKYRLMSVEEIALSCEEMIEMLEGEEWDDPNWWHAGYIPFASDDGGDYLLIDTAAHLAALPGEVMDWAHAAPMRILICGSLRGFIESVVVALENGAASPEEDWEQYKAAFSGCNPGYPVMHILQNS